MCIKKVLLFLFFFVGGVILQNSFCGKQDQAGGSKSVYPGKINVIPDDPEDGNQVVDKNFYKYKIKKQHDLTKVFAEEEDRTESGCLAFLDSIFKGGICSAAKVLCSSEEKAFLARTKFKKKKISELKVKEEAHKEYTWIKGENVYFVELDLRDSTKTYRNLAIKDLGTFMERLVDLFFDELEQKYGGWAARCEGDSTLFVFLDVEGESNEARATRAVVLAMEAAVLYQKVQKKIHKTLGIKGPPSCGIGVAFGKHVRALSPPVNKTLGLPTWVMGKPRLDSYGIDRAENCQDMTKYFNEKYEDALQENNDHIPLVITEKVYSDICKVYSGFKIMLKKDTFEDKKTSEKTTVYVTTFNRIISQLPFYHEHEEMQKLIKEMSELSISDDESSDSEWGDEDSARQDNSAFYGVSKDLFFRQSVAQLPKNKIDPPRGPNLFNSILCGGCFIANIFCCDAFVPLMSFFSKKAFPKVDMDVDKKDKLALGKGIHVFFKLPAYKTCWKNKEGGERSRWVFMLDLQYKLFTPLAKEYGMNFVGNGNGGLFVIMKEKNEDYKRIAKVSVLFGMALVAGYHKLLAKNEGRGPLRCSVGIEAGEFCIHPSPGGKAKIKLPSGIAEMPPAVSIDITNAYGAMTESQKMNMLYEKNLGDGNYVPMGISERIYKNLFGAELQQYFRKEQAVFRKKKDFTFYATTLWHIDRVFQCV